MDFIQVNKCTALQQVYATISDAHEKGITHELKLRVLAIKISVPLLKEGLVLIPHLNVIPHSTGGHHQAHQEQRGEGGTGQGVGSESHPAKRSIRGAQLSLGTVNVHLKMP